MAKCAHAMEAAIKDHETWERLKVHHDELMRELDRAYGLPEDEIKRIEQEREAAVQEIIDAEIERTVRAYAGERSQ
jgi:type III secretory pathway component EscU